MFDLRVISVLAAFVTVGPTSAMTFSSPDLYRSSLAAKSFPGVGGLGLAGGGGIVTHECTGTLVASNVVLTAKHCIMTGDFTFFLPTPDDAAATGGLPRMRRVKSYVAIKDYRGTGADTDLALLTLDEPLHGARIYELYTHHDEIGKVFTAVGAGMSGLMREGARYEFSSLRLRAGQNRYDTTRTALAAFTTKRFGGGIEPADDVLLMDNDNGRAKNDVFGRYLGIHDLGVRRHGRLVEAGLAYVDSGGPDFIDGKIAGIHSFAASGSFLERADGKGCGPNSVDPVAGNRWGCSDGSHGDFAGSVRVSFYVDTIRAYIAAAKQ